MKPLSWPRQLLWKCAVLSLFWLAGAFTSTTMAADDRVKIDNEQARVLVVSSAPGARSELHEHLMNRVMVYLDAGRMVLTDTQGEVEALNFKANEALWSPATKRPHVSLNLSKLPVRIVEVELKSKPDAPDNTRPGATDWAKADAKHCQVEFENSQVRVVRVRFAPHDKGVLHEHSRNYLRVFLTECQLKITVAGGKAETTTAVPGDVAAGTPTKHEEQNLGDKAAELVVIEFKN